MARQCLPSLAQRSLKKNLAADNFDCVTSNTDVNYTVIAARSAHENPAGTPHLDSLFDENMLLRLSHAVGDHPGRCAAGGRAGCRIFAVVDQHPGMQTCLRVDGFPCHEVEE